MALAERVSDKVYFPHAQVGRVWVQRAPPVFSSAAWTASSAEDMPRPKG